MTQYYDIHTHILPGVDDGSRSEEETGKMLKMAYEQGVRHIIATPHYAKEDKNASKDTLQKALQKTHELAAKISPEFTIDLGNELLNGPGVIEALKSGEALTIANTRYILVEFLPSDKYSVLYQSLREYINAGYIPVVAHMERYESLYKEYENLDELLKLGVYFQMNTESIVGGMFNRRAAYHRSLIRDGYIHFLGSDCHRSDRRMPLMKDAFKNMEKDFANSRMGQKILVENPRTMLADKYISA